MAKLRKADFLRLGLEILGESGIDGLTIAVMCARLRVTKGSFYHHFASMPVFHSALLEHWEREHTDRLIEASETALDPRARILALTEISVELPHATEAAIRAWGKSNLEAARSQARVDAVREERVRNVLLGVGVDPDEAELLADIAMSLLVGFQLRKPLELVRLQSMMVEINRLVFIEARP